MVNDRNPGNPGIALRGSFALSRLSFFLLRFERSLVLRFKCSLVFPLAPFPAPNRPAGPEIL